MLLSAGIIKELHLPQYLLNVLNTWKQIFSLYEKVWTSLNLVVWFKCSILAIFWNLQFGGSIDCYL